MLFPGLELKVTHKKLVTEDTDSKDRDKEIDTDYDKFSICKSLSLNRFGAIGLSYEKRV